LLMETNFIKNITPVTIKAIGGYNWIIIKKNALTGAVV
jgi:hypothetical protein